MVAPLQHSAPSGNVLCPVWVRQHPPRHPHVLYITPSKFSKHFYCFLLVLHRCGSGRRINFPAHIACHGGQHIRMAAHYCTLPSSVYCLSKTYCRPPPLFAQHTLVGFHGKALTMQYMLKTVADRVLDGQCAAQRIVSRVVGCIKKGMTTKSFVCTKHAQLSECVSRGHVCTDSARTREHRCSLNIRHFVIRGSTCIL